MQANTRRSRFFKKLSKDDNSLVQSSNRRTIDLHRESQKLENELANLQAEKILYEEKSIHFSAKKSYWDGASIDKGSFRKYDWNGNTKQRGIVGGTVAANSLENQSLRPSTVTNIKKKISKNQNNCLVADIHVDEHGLRSKDVGQWNVKDIQCWLSLLGLNQYNKLFERNGVDGLKLLSFNRNDLKHLNILSQSHRNILEKGINDLKRNGQPMRVAPFRSAYLEEKLEAIADIKNNSFSTDSIWLSSIHPKKSLSCPDDLQKQAPYSDRNVETLQNLVFNRALEKDSMCSLLCGDILWRNPLKHQKTENLSEEKNLLDGSYDEERESKLFQRAVLSWRLQKKSDSEQHPAKEKDEKRNSSLHACRSADFAADLLKQMENDHNTRLDQIKIRKKELHEISKFYEDQRLVKDLENCSLGKRVLQSTITDQFVDEPMKSDEFIKIEVISSIAGEQEKDSEYRNYVVIEEN